MGSDKFRPGTIYELTLSDGHVIRNPAGWRLASLHVCPACGQAPCVGLGE